MLRSTSVVMTTMRACELMFVSPVSSPTDSGAVLGDELVELLVAQRLHRRRVEHLVAGLLHRHEDRELGDDGLAGTGRRGDQHALALLEHVARGELERVEVEALAVAERLQQRGVPALLRGGEPFGGRELVGHSSVAGTAASASVTVGPARDSAVVDGRDQHREEVERDHRDREQEHRHDVGGRGRDRAEHRDDQHGDAPALEDGLGAQDADEVQQHEEHRQHEGDADREHELDDEVVVDPRVEEGGVLLRSERREQLDHVREQEPAGRAPGEEQRHRREEEAEGVLLLRLVRPGTRNAKIWYSQTGLAMMIAIVRAIWKCRSNALETVV